MVWFENLFGTVQASHLITTITHPLLFFVQLSLGPPLTLSAIHTHMMFELEGYYYGK